MKVEIRKYQVIEKYECENGDIAASACGRLNKEDNNKKEDKVDVLGVEDRGEKDQSTIYAEFQESITRKEDGRYEVAVPWIPGAVLSNTNEEPSRKRLHNVNRKLKQNQQLKDEYEKIVHEQLKDGVIEKTKESSNGERVFYMPHKPVIKENASTTKTGSDIADLEDFKREATEILEDAKFPVHKWESNVEELDNESNPSKILGYKWNTEELTIDESDTDDGEEVVKLHKRMKQKREDAWQRWKTEYVHSLMEHHRVIKGENASPEVGEMMLVVGEEKN
ncbi:Hypothetical predicted protein [Paramuricea clavata]|uniref:Uncharacterized protein n=1 Tax=Paramuricea clavata TaxID=317549 RepID=A0A7D9HME0_PARCT|nr:Hypothetical predicted protein [Paramuricea clavata]